MFTQPFIRAHIKENIKTPRHWPLCGEFTDEWWIPHTRASNAENVSIWWSAIQLSKYQRTIAFHRSPDLPAMKEAHSEGFEPCFITSTKRCRKTLGQWECSFHSNLHCHWLKGLGQRQVALVVQGPCWDDKMTDYINIYINIYIYIYIYVYIYIWGGFILSQKYS